MLDGYPLAQAGKGAKAVKMALYSSVFGDTFSDVCLIFFASALALVALQFGPAEYTLLIVLALGSLGMLSSRPIWKGLVATLVGVMIGIIGLDPITATERLTFGNPELEEGIGLIPMLIGFLAVSEVFRQMGDYHLDYKLQYQRYLSFGELVLPQMCGTDMPLSYIQIL